MSARHSWVVGAPLALLSGSAAAHSFGRVYNLPLPFWLYAWGAAVALVASFLLLGYFVAQPSTAHDRPVRDYGDSAVLRRLRQWRLPLLMQVFSVGGLALCIVAGFVGTRSPYGNFNMTFFWIVFVLGFTYLTALVGNLYALLNPWRVLAAGIGRGVRRYRSGLLRYPAALSYWPALGFYMAFIWIELFAGTTPYSLAVMLAIYSVINLLGAGLFGIHSWFRYCEFFGVFLRLVARMAPLEYAPPGPDGAPGRLRLHAPFMGLVRSQTQSMSLLLFILFMLSSTAFDGLRETVIWQKLFWLDLYRGALQDWIGSNPLAAYPKMRALSLWWHGSWLLLSPFLYLAVYLLFIVLTRWLVNSRLSVRSLALAFAYPLIPIALVYNITHYYTLIQTQGIKIISLASDPLGLGWNLFGTARWLQRTIIPDPGTVWHVQAALIVLGHIISVYAAHEVALRVFPNRRQALLSQVPMLILMVLFTTAGLWILSQPMQSGA